MMIHILVFLKDYAHSDERQYNEKGKKRMISFQENDFLSTFVVMGRRRQKQKEIHTYIYTCKYRNPGISLSRHDGLRKSQIGAIDRYVAATISRFLKMIGLFCKRAL